MQNDRRTRNVDHSTRDARRAVADAVGTLEPYRSRLAVITARAHRQLPADERLALRKECLAIRSALQEARTELLTQLIEAPTKVTAHSRVVDVEKALDNLEGTLAEAARRL